MCDPLIDFLVPGAQKSGTTALRWFLKDHPEIGLASDLREVHYFDKVADGDETDATAYHSRFSKQSFQKVVGDFTPIYMFLPRALQLAQKYNPDFKLIVLLRQPAERAYSHWAMGFRRGSEKSGFVQALLEEPYHAVHNSRHRVHSYMQRGFYAAQIRLIYSLFPKESCLILLTEDLSRNHAETLSKIYSFLNVSQIDPPQPDTIHSGGHAGIPMDLKILLTRIFERDICDLERLINRDLSDWKVPAIERAKVVAGR